MAHLDADQDVERHLILVAVEEAKAEVGGGTLGHDHIVDWHRRGFLGHLGCNWLIGRAILSLSIGHVGALRRVSIGHGQHIAHLEAVVECRKVLTQRRESQERDHDDGGEARTTQPVVCESLRVPAEDGREDIVQRAYKEQSAGPACCDRHDKDPKHYHEQQPEGEAEVL